ncbi:hypothetical protein [Paraliomyxa miuraensis]|uniref:hypothetical protein n=1 Tax=Paraliomyxa miuraensis TaxID=376150 RepID=UPI00224F2C90|nr:hypothetical protein [Paraliomyxa miuraensis]MCX4244207.1 hypothetical protein [Paraliomyxa miuraensis]
MEQEAEQLLLLLVAVLALDAAQAHHVVVLALVGLVDVLPRSVEDLGREIGRRHAADQEEGAVVIGEIVAMAIVLPAVLGGDVAGLAHLPPQLEHVDPLRGMTREDLLEQAGSRVVVGGGGIVGSYLAEGHEVLARGTSSNVG